MALNILSDEDRAKRDRKPKNTVDFQFRSGTLTADGKPKGLSKWRVTTGDPEIADSIAQLFGGTPNEYDATRDQHLEVLTDHPSVEIVIDGPEAIEDKLILWGRNGALLHECDGETYLSPDDQRGTPCDCPRTIKARKAKARKGTGPAPQIRVAFRLADDYDLGMGRFQTSSWQFAEVLFEVQEALAAVGEPALCRMRIVKVEWEDEDGEPQSFRKPVIDVIGSYNAAIAEDR